ncbi:MAG: FtsX-like permease family protein [bacterium]|nr:FtsX-like permease family protein [bacterium]
MLFYNLRLGWISLRRTPVLSFLTVGAIGLGIAVATTFVTVYYLFSADPIPHKSDDLYTIRLDSWDPDRPWSDNRPEVPPSQLTYRDAVALMESDVPTHHSAMFRSFLFVHPEGPGKRPFRADIRLCYRDFFPMFDLPFAAGGPWSREADRVPEAVVVLDAATNQRLFGGHNSVGRKLRIDQRQFTVVGVLEPWRPLVKFYDTTAGAWISPEEIFIPFQLAREMEIDTAGNTHGWAADYRTLAEKFESESAWIQFWAELRSPEQLAAYQQFLDAYARDERRLGRFQRPINNWIQPLTAWLDEDGVVPPESRSLMVISLLFLSVCSINLIGLLLSKFLARAPEIGVRRALGASRRAVFLQHLVECLLIGGLGGMLGVALGAGGLALINRMFEDLRLYLDVPMVLTAILLALVSGILAGTYPAWRICSIAPADHLKLQ